MSERNSLDLGSPQMVPPSPAFEASFKEVEQSLLHHVGDLVALEAGSHQHDGAHAGDHVVGCAGLRLLEEWLALLLPPCAPRTSRTAPPTRSV